MTEKKPLNWILSVAPMMGVTDRHFRFLLRQIAPQTLLYTEMVTSPAIVHGNVERLLAFNDQEHPVALQLGGSDPQELAVAAKHGVDFGYDEINLNIGCPSDRVQAGRFGACLMKEPQRVAECVAEIKKHVTVPVTVKTRIGVDDHDSFELLCKFTESMVAAGCDALMVHARKAWLKGLSPKQNRNIPPLNYDRVHCLKQCFPSLPVIINGGITDVDHAKDQLRQVDGVMVGRAIQTDPWRLRLFEHALMNEGPDLPGRQRVLVNYLEYIESQRQLGVPLRPLLQALIPFMHGQPGAKHWRRLLNDAFQTKMPNLATLTTVFEPHAAS